MNLIGLVNSESGLGQGCRLLAGAAEAEGIPFDVVGYHFDCSKKGAGGFDHRMASDAEARFGVNVAQMTVDGVVPAVLRMGRDLWRGRYNIAHFSWELPVVPKRWRRQDGFFDEITTGGSTGRSLT